MSDYKPTNPATLAILADLTAEEVRELTASLVARERKKARTEAPIWGDLFASSLKVAGEPELARQVGVILDTLRQDYVSKGVR